jgi:hypothetical protein
MNDTELERYQAHLLNTLYEEVDGAIIKQKLLSSPDSAVDTLRTYIESTETELLEVAAQLTQTWSVLSGSP